MGAIKESAIKRNFHVGIPEYLYTLTLVIYAPLSIYSSGLSGFAISDVLLLAVAFYVLFCRKSINIHFAIFPFLIYIIFNSLFQSEDTSELLRTFRYVTYLLFVVLFAKRFFVYHLALDLYIKIAVFATFFLFVQFILYNTVHFYLPGYLPFLELNREGVTEYTENIYYASEATQRMRSIFTEPAHYAAYVLICLLLLMVEGNKKQIKIILFLTLGIVISASATGILSAAFCWMYFIFKLFRNKISLKHILFLGCIICFCGFLLSTSSFETFLMRMEEGRSQDNRFRGYAAVWTMLSNDSTKLMYGIGMKLYEYYLAGWIRMLLYFGIIGITLYAIPLAISSFGNVKSRLLCLMLFALGVGTSIIVSATSMLPLAFIFTLSSLNKKTPHELYKKNN